MFAAARTKRAYTVTKQILPKSVHVRRFGFRLAQTSRLSEHVQPFVAENYDAPKCINADQMSDESSDDVKPEVAYFPATILSMICETQFNWMYSR